MFETLPKMPMTNYERSDAFNGTDTRTQNDRYVSAMEKY